MARLKNSDNSTAVELNTHIFIARTITQANMLEGMIDAYIAEFYTKCPEADYQQPYLTLMYDVLNNSRITLYTKIDILFKVFKRINPDNATKAKRNIYIKWLELRNKLAHGRFIGDNEGGRLLYGGEYYDAATLADEFIKLQQDIMKHLEVYRELRGPYFNHIPTKNWEKKK